MDVLVTALFSMQTSFSEDMYQKVELLSCYHEQRSLVGYSPWDRKELDTTEQLAQKVQKYFVLVYEAS